MHASLQIRCHSDGSIDFAFYRRRAARNRQSARRMIFRRCVIDVAEAMRTVLATIKKLSSRDGDHRVTTG